MKNRDWLLTTCECGHSLVSHSEEYFLICLIRGCLCMRFGYSFEVIKP